MTAAMTPARRLLAMLEEERSLETRPLDEVLADLQAHGVDAAGPIRLARRLAESNAGPAAALLGAVIEDEAVEAEIAALEAAPIDDVRDRLDVGTVAAVAAEAKRRGGSQSNVVGLRRRKSVAWAWAGSLVGMAACALIVVAAWWPPSELMPTSPDIASVEVRSAAPEAPEAAPPAAMEAARPEPDYSMAPPESRALGRLAANTELAEGEADGVGGDAEVAPALPSRQAGSEVPGIASRMADPVEPPALSAGAGDSAPAVALDREPPAPASSDGVSAGAAPTLPEALSGAAEAQLPPLPSAKPEDGRALADDVRSEPATAAGAAAQPSPPPDWADQLAVPAERFDGAGRGLQVEAEPGDPVLRYAGAIALVVDGVVYPRILGVGAGREWSDGAFPILYPDGAAGTRTTAIGLLPDPIASGAAGAVNSLFGSGGAVLIDPGADLGDASPQDELRTGPSSLAAGLVRGLVVMLRDAGATGADPWTGQVADRLADARSVADGGAVLAILTIRAANVRADAVLLPREPGAPAAGDPLLPLLTHWFGDDAARFRLIILPPR